MPSASLASVMLSLASAVSWGAGDFSGGIAAKKTNVFFVVAVAHGTGLVLVLLLAVLMREQIPSTKILLWGAAAGIAGAVGLASLYRGLAIGKMGVVGPVAGVITAALPVIYGASTQGLPKTLQLCGFALAFVGIVLVSKPEKTEGVPPGLWLAMLAGVGFGMFLIFIQQAGTSSVYWPLASARTVSLFLMLLALAFSKANGPMSSEQKTARKLERKLWPIMIFAGAMDTLGNALFMMATQTGRLDVAAVLSSLYPATTVLLARFLLQERVSAIQNVGMVAAIASIPLIAG
jgi:drug/metabolite transporter (DMT)-like permease